MQATRIFSNRYIVSHPLQERILSWSALYIYHILCTVGARPQPGAIYSNTSSPLYLENPLCIGDELSLIECQQDMDNMCSHRNDVGVQCEGTCMHLKLGQVTFLLGHHPIFVLVCKAVE